jgi:putative heme-binding domain-containing protein
MKPLLSPKLLLINAIRVFGISTKPRTYLTVKVPLKLFMSTALHPLHSAPKPKLPHADKILALKADPDNGKQQIGRCYVCHKVGSVGVEFGPTLAGWGSGQNRETILKAITNPSADLAHGYEGTELLVKGDKRIQGFIQAEGDPLVIRVFGGEDLVIAKSDIKSRKKMSSSLMAPASSLGLKCPATTGYRGISEVELITIRCFLINLYD